MVLLDSEYSKIELIDGILVATWKVEYIDLGIAKRAVRERLEVTGQTKYPTLLRIKSIQESSKEARDFFASKEGCEGLSAGAFCAESILEKMIASLFVYLNKPLVPTKVFNSEAKAIEWLKRFK